MQKKLQTEGQRLGRDGLSQRVCDLVSEFAAKYPDGHYFEAIKLAGKLHALYLATGPHDYWREVAQRGFTAELNDLKKFEKRNEGQV